MRNDSLHDVLKVHVVLFVLQKVFRNIVQRIAVEFVVLAHHLDQIDTQHALYVYILYIGRRKRFRRPLHGCYLSLFVYHPEVGELVHAHVVRAVDHKFKVESKYVPSRYNVRLLLLDELCERDDQIPFAVYHRQRSVLYDRTRPQCQ
uniref:Uncharacterized protein n=1 Tax=Diadromus pulchellus ascovirus 4a TaxID=158683 RepID=Q9DSV6_9VIRU|nr:hypothetical protein [Diadromus pulchellus ascovirus 4a]